MKTNLHLLQIFLILSTKSSNNFLVGGCVRDYLLNFPIKDYDIVTDIPILELSEMFSTNGWKVINTGASYLVLTISKDGSQYEIANFRKDGIYLNGRCPTNVEIGDIYQDAKRRDFTINAIYYNPITDEYIYPIDKSKQDIKNRTLRFIGNASDRINEDYLRVFRFYRFLACKNLNPDVRSLKACREYFNKACELTSHERIRVEIERMINL